MPALTKLTANFQAIQSVLRSRIICVLRAVAEPSDKPEVAEADNRAAPDPSCPPSASEFLHIPTGKRVSVVIAQVLADHHPQQGQALATVALIGRIWTMGEPRRIVSTAKTRRRKRFCRSCSTALK